MKRIILHIHTFCLLTLLCPAGLAAQSVIRGIVIDRESQLPVEAATVQLTRGNVSFPINYTLSNNEGTFTLTQPKRTDSLLVSVSLLGYQTQQQAVHAGQTLRFEMEPQVFSLKEVEIRPGRVWGRQDTINYDVTRFLSPKDQSIKDVLRKLPGIDIDDLGKISYNGKEIRNFYVEGLDLTNGKYKQISENLRADAVQNIQVMENHQPIRVLQRKIKTEDVALNLKLRPEFRDRWLINAEGGLGASPFLWKGAADALQISRSSQSAYRKYSINSLVYWVTYVHNVVYSFYRSMIYCYINSTQRCAGSIVIDIIPTNGADKRKFFPFAPYFPVTNVIKRYFYPYFPAIIGIKGYSFPYFPYLSGIMKIKTALYSLFSRLDWHKTVVFPCLGEIYEGIRSLSWEIPVT